MNTVKVMLSGSDVDSEEDCVLLGDTGVESVELTVGGETKG